MEQYRNTKNKSDWKSRWNNVATLILKLYIFNENYYQEYKSYYMNKKLIFKYSNILKLIKSNGSII